MRFPSSLSKGGTIGFAAPSFGCATEPYKSAFHNAQKRLSERGFESRLGPNCYLSEGIGISNSPEKCGEEIMDMFASEADVLISCGGGEMMCEILPYVDFGRLAQLEPKWFMGYSDNTNLTYLLATLADTASIYGPCAAAFGMEPWHASLEDAFGILTGECSTVKGYGLWEKESLKNEEHPLLPYNVTAPLEIKSYVGNRRLLAEEEICFSGRLIGGCMDCLVNLTGTRFDKTKEFLEKYREDGFIWFLEACELNVFAIRRAMWQMEEAGWFGYVKGFLIGRPDNGDSIINLDRYGAVLDIIGRKNVPVIMDADIGHRPPMMPLVVGSLATVNVKGNDISVKMECR